MKPRKIENLNKAFLDLKESLAKPIQENRDVGGVVKAFEIVFEFSWKILQDLNQEMSTPSSGTLRSLRKSF